MTDDAAPIQLREFLRNTTDKVPGGSPAGEKIRHNDATCWTKCQPFFVSGTSQIAENLEYLFDFKEIFIERIGAGEGIRTLDPNLGKVMLYP